MKKMVICRDFRLVMPLALALHKALTFLEEIDF
jgi:hypothetical protein